LKGSSAGRSRKISGKYDYIDGIWKENTVVADFLMESMKKSILTVRMSEQDCEDDDQN
jgi:hypothetical protein